MTHSGTQRRIFDPRSPAFVTTEQRCRRTCQHRHRCYSIGGECRRFVRDRFISFFLAIAAILELRHYQAMPRDLWRVERLIVKRPFKANSWCADEENTKDEDFSSGTTRESLYDTTAAAPGKKQLPKHHCYYMVR